eukprot:TRINITY_DN20347_c4_g1_i1.p1 TRINITY_DN20347_c4_g1~~TRINITY_DN20347_c4_g1_i1.p1  ORF type:complete len:133 (-),score=1.20 TRINITY_DN20347_c4_g1_i1:422-820(-)
MANKFSPSKMSTKSIQQFSPIGWVPNLGLVTSVVVPILWSTWMDHQVGPIRYFGTRCSPCCEHQCSPEVFLHTQDPNYMIHANRLSLSHYLRMHLFAVEDFLRDIWLRKNTISKEKKPIHLLFFNVAKSIFQ